MPSYHGSQRTTAVHPGLTLRTAANQVAAVRAARYGKDSTSAGVVERVTLARYTGGTTPTTRADKRNTRSVAAQAQAQSWSTGPTISGNPLVVVDCGDKPVLQQTWRPPRPWACVYLIDAETVGLDATSVANNSTNYDLAWSEPGADDRPLRGRRPSRKGLYHYYNHTSIIRGGIATNPRTHVRSNWTDVLTHRIRPYRSPNSLLLAPPAGQTIAAAQAFETDTATPITRQKVRAVGQALETATATALTRQKLRAVGLASDATVAQPLTRQKVRAVGQMLETDTAQPITQPGPTTGIGYVVGGEIEGLSNASVASYTPDQWPSLLAGDVAVLYVATGTAGPPTITVTAPGGGAYDASTPVDSGTVLRMQRFTRKIASNGEGAPTIALSPSSNSSCSGFSLRGVHPSQLTDVTDTTASTTATATTITLPALSVVTSGAWLGCGYASRVAAAPYPNLTGGAGYTERAQRAASSTGSGTTTAAYTRTANPVTTGGNPYNGASFSHDIVGGARQVIMHTALRPAPAGAGQTKAVGQALSTETATALGRQKLRAVAQASSVDTATPLGRQKVRPVAQASSTDTATPIIRQKVRGAAQALSTDTATQIARRKLRTVAQALSVDTATALVRQKLRAVAQALSTDTATQIARRKLRTAGQAFEADTATSVGRQKVRGAAQALEADTATALGRQKRRNTGQALEADTATTVGHRKSKLLGQALEADTAQPVTRSGAARIIAQAFEADTATALARRKQRAVAQALETDTAPPITRRKQRPVAEALEADTATALGRVKTRGVAQASDAETATPITRRKQRLVAEALEADTATALVPKGIVRTIGRALEIDTAQAIVVVHTIARVLEAEGALSVAGAAEGDQMPGREVSGLSGASEPLSGQGMLAVEVSGSQSAGG